MALQKLNGFNIEKNGIKYTVRLEGEKTDTTNDDKIIITANNGNATQTISIFTGTSVSDEKNKNLEKHLDAKDLVTIEASGDTFAVDKRIMHSIINIIGTNNGNKTIQDFDKMQFDPTQHEAFTKNDNVEEGPIGLFTNTINTTEALAKHFCPEIKQSENNPVDLTQFSPNAFLGPDQVYGNAGWIKTPSITRTVEVKLTKEQKARLKEYQTKLQELNNKRQTAANVLNRVQAREYQARLNAERWNNGNPCDEAWRQGYLAAGHGPADNHYAILLGKLKQAQAQLESADAELDKLNEDYKDIVELTKNKTITEDGRIIADPGANPDKKITTGPNAPKEDEDKKPKSLKKATEEATKLLEEAKKTPNNTNAVNAINDAKEELGNGAELKDLVEKMGTNQAIEVAENIVKKAKENEAKEPNKAKKLEVEVTPLIKGAKEQAENAANAYAELGAAVAKLDELIKKAAGKKDNDTDMIKEIEDARKKVEDARKKALDAEKDAKEARDKAHAALKKAIEIANTPEDKIKPANDTNSRLNGA